MLFNIDIKERSIYNLRHTFASHMISNIHKGINILWVSKSLGHKDVSITLKIYAKYIIEDDYVRMNKLKDISSFFEKFIIKRKYLVKNIQNISFCIY